MRILLVNKYLYPKGGSERSMSRIADLLRGHGHTTAYMGMAGGGAELASGDPCFLVPEVDYRSPGAFGARILQAARLIVNRTAREVLGRAVREFHPQLLQAHNIYHQITPSIYTTAKKHGLPIVQYLHDYKIVCPVYTLLKADGRVCPNRCARARFHWCTLLRCKNGRFLDSLANSIEMYAHRTLLRYYDLVDLFISPSAFLTNTVQAMGYLPKRLITIPHFVQTEGVEPRFDWAHRRIVYYGRLSPEKGIATLIDAVQGLPVELMVIGSGQLDMVLRSRVEQRNQENVVFVPHQDQETLFRLLRDSMFVVVPSEWYENCPNTVFQSFALGKPVVGARIGGIPEMVIDGRTGYTFPAGNTEELKNRIQTLLASPEHIQELGREARRMAESDLSPHAYYRRYAEAVGPLSADITF